MSSKIRRQQMHAAKQRRQKQIAIGGGVVLAVLLAIQAPRLLHHGGSSAAATTAAETTAGVTTAGETTPTSTLAGDASAAPTDSTAVGASVATGAPTTHTRLPDSDVAPLRLRTQLASFELFDSKDPFVQQVSDQPAPTAGAVPAPAAPAPGAAAGSGTAPATPTAPATVIASTTQSQGTARTLAHNSGAVIEVNGKAERVGVDQAFPSSSPTFRLVSLANGVAMVGIAGGAYASGAQTVALQAGRTLTLVNTSDGVRYELRLVSTS